MSDMTPPGREENSSFTPGDASASGHGQSLESTVPAGMTKKSRARLLVVLLVIVAIGVGGYAFSTKASSNDIGKIQGKVALTEQELKDVVAAKHLTVYWAGPQAGAKYALVVSNPNSTYIRYLPGGVGLNDTQTLFRVIGTYVVKNAFKATASTENLVGNTGFVNADGNAVAYSTVRTTNVYVGIKGKDIQVEIFDPVADAALGLATASGQVQLVA